MRSHAEPSASPLPVDWRSRCGAIRPQGQTGDYDQGWYSYTLGHNGDGYSFEPAPAQQVGASRLAVPLAASLVRPSQPAPVRDQLAVSVQNG